MNAAAAKARIQRLQDLSWGLWCEADTVRKEGWLHIPERNAYLDALHEMRRASGEARLVLREAVERIEREEREYQERIRLAREENARDA